MMLNKVSVIIPAHNEEKMIAESLRTVLMLDYPDLEVIICLDGCTDDTEYVVNDVIGKYKTNKRVTILKNNKRLGKATTIMRLLKVATGEIIILNDADWKFVTNNEKFDKLINIFDNPNIGGVHLGTTLGFVGDLKRASNIKSILYLGNAWSCILITKYQKEKFTKKIDGVLYADKNKMIYPFMIDIFRKNIIDNINTPCDDGEFTDQILHKGYELVVLEEGYPVFEDMNRILTVDDVIKTKIRGAKGRDLLESKPNMKQNKFYFLIFPYILLNIFEVKPMRAKIGLLAWIFLTIISLLFKSLLLQNNYSDKELWKMKVRRV